MSVEIVTGSIFESNCQVLVNPVNCVGVMGAGLALEFKNRYPQYAHTVINTIRMEIGKCHAYYFGDGLPIYIVSFPTKDHWKNPSKLAWVEAGLSNLVPLLDSMVQVHDPEWPLTVAIPALGCGNGGLKWEDVKQLIVQKLEPYTWMKVKLYEPTNT